MIAVLLSLCSRNQGWKSVDDIDFFKVFLRGFYNTISKEFNNKYIFYLGYDSDDEFIKGHLDTIKKRLHERDIIIELDAKITSGNPCQAWNILAKEALKNEDIKYFYQVGTDTLHMTPFWDKYFINIIEKNGGRGICGGVDKYYYLERTLSNKQGIIENAFLTRNHILQFDGIFPKEYKNWFSDDWITDYYKQLDMCFITPYIYFYNTNRVLLQNQGDISKNRYEPDRRDREDSKDSNI